MTTSTFTLAKQGVGTPLVASVSYDDPSRTATLNPSGLLEPNATFVATVEGGAGGVKDLDGNPLASDVVWTFQTNGSPTPVIDTPPSTLTWEVGELISFSGHATDPEQGTLPASALTWTLLLQHCPSNCHSHTVQTWNGVANGSFNAPDHEYPSHLELRLTATDAGGANGSTEVELQPETIDLTFQTVPPGLELVVGADTLTTPATRTFISGSTISLSAPTPQVLDDTTYHFSSWSDGAAQTHSIVASPSPTTYTATYATVPVSTSPPRIRSTLSYPPVLSVGNGAWSGSLPMTLSYQWLRCATVEIESCDPILGAHRANLRPWVRRHRLPPTRNGDRDERGRIRHRHVRAHRTVLVAALAADVPLRLGQHLAEDSHDLVELRLARDERRRDLDHGSPRSSARQTRPASNSALERNPRMSCSHSCSVNLSRVSRSFTSSIA